MFINNREMPVELLYYNALSARTELTANEKYQMALMKKGYEGECLYDKIFDEIGHGNVYIFRDVYLKIGSTTTQYDSIVITDNRVTVNEIKIFQGDIHYSKDNWYKKGYPLQEDAFAQLRRAQGKLMKLSKNSGVNFEVTGALIFINDDFRITSDKDDIWEKTIVRSHLRGYLQNLNSVQKSDKAQKIANIINKYRVNNIYFNEKADISRLKLGFYCSECRSYDLIKRRFHFTCSKCGSIESNETHLLRAISDYKFLFYNQPVTKKSLLYLIDNQLKRSAVGRLLRKHCVLENKGRSAEHIFKYHDLNAALIATKDQRYKDKITRYSE